MEFLENIKINEYAIKLEKHKQPSFESIHSLKPIELEILKTNIEINLTNGFIWPFKFPNGAFILFNKKPNRNFRFCISY